jgi:signal transduction histidine kinase/CheY-like chemotaxis protein
MEGNMPVPTHSLEERGSILLQTTARVAKLAASNTELDQYLQDTVDAICQELGFYYAGIFLLDGAGEWAILRAGYGEAGKKLLAEGHKLKVSGKSMIGVSIHLHQTQISSDVSKETMRFDNPRLPKTRSEIALPLIFAEKVIGAMSVQSEETDAFSQDDVTALEAITDMLAVIIQDLLSLGKRQEKQADLSGVWTYETLAAAATEVIHWIGSKAMPITTTVARLKEDLQAGKNDPDSLWEDLDQIAESALRIVEVKENLLGPAREQRLRPVMLVDLWQAAAQHRKIPLQMLEIQVDPHTPLVLGDSTQMVRAFGNLLQNSFEADARHIRLEIAPLKERDEIEMKLSDDGQGLPSEDRDKIWSAFFTTKGPEHQGLGLVACLHVISRLGGIIALENRADEGAIVTIRLPAINTPPRPANLDAAPQNILLIDDEDAWAEFVIGKLASAGKKVTMGQSAEQMEAVDLILVDEALVSADAMEVLQALKEAGLAEKTLLVAASLEVEKVITYMQTGIKDAVLKPYTPGELAEILV